MQNMLALSEAETAHVAADVVLQDSVNGVSAWMPERHSRRVVLDVEEFEACAQSAVV
jgi:hypothetical protein